MLEYICANWMTIEWPLYAVTYMWPYGHFLIWCDVYTQKNDWNDFYYLWNL
jgi:hypothetical protein